MIFLNRAKVPVISLARLTVFVPRLSKLIDCPLHSEGTTIAQTPKRRGEEAQLALHYGLFVPGAIQHVIGRG